MMLQPSEQKYMSTIARQVITQEYTVQKSDWKSQSGAEITCSLTQLLDKMTFCWTYPAATKTVMQKQLLLAMISDFFTDYLFRINCMNSSLTSLVWRSCCISCPMLE